MFLRMLLLSTVAMFCFACAKQAQSTVEVQEKQTKQEPVPVEENPFFVEWTAPFGAPPFESIKTEHYKPAFLKAMELHKAEVAAIVDNPDAPTFKNTIEAMQNSGELLEKVAGVFFSMDGANTSPELQAVSGEILPILSKHGDDIAMNQKLFDRTSAVYQKRAELSLTPEQLRILEQNYKDFVRGGAALDEAGKAELRKINETMTMLTYQFGDNLLKETNSFELVLESTEDLAGLPEGVVAAAAEMANAKEKPGKWVITLDSPSRIPFLTYSQRRDLREKVLEAYISRGDNNNESDNKELVTKMANLRVQKAKLFEFDTYADFKADVRMAKTADAIDKLNTRLWKPALKMAKKEAAALQKMIRKEGGKFKLEPWDWWYYTEKLRKAKYDLDDEELRPYFKLENVLNGAFDLATRLYGIKFVPRTDIPIYHPDVQVFEVKEADDTHIGLFYVDYFPRPSKRGGAWCGGFRSQHKKDGTKITPLITNVGNFTKPTADTPSLLSFEEVTTLFHEFGHGLHALFSDVTYSGHSMPTDFVELPSQIMENWAAEPEMLKMYAKHYETGEPIPDELIGKIKKSGRFNQGFITVEYLAACFLDLAWHGLDKPTDIKSNEFETKVLKDLGLIPQIVVRYRSPYFAHIFTTDYYAAGYYSYVWSAVLDADAFEAFKQNGLFDKATAKSFREKVLNKGGSEEPMDMYKNFRGAEPDIKALLKRKGFK